MRVITRLLTTGNRTLLALAGATLVAIAGSPRCLAQSPSPVYVDDSPAATEGLLRANELAAVGNLTEAAGVLQHIMTEFGGSVVAAGTPGDDDLFISVREKVYLQLLANPALLARYRETQGDGAQRALKAGRVNEVEERQLLTAAGFDAALIVAESQLENARFEAALLTLDQLEKHPDRTMERGTKAAELLTRLASYTRGATAEDAWARVARWRADARLEPAARSESERPPEPAVRDTFGVGDALLLDGLLERPLASDRIGEPIDTLRSLVAGSMLRDVPETAMTLHAAPSVSGDLVYVNDGERVSAWDRFTLTLRWRQHVDSPPSMSTAFAAASTLEEMNRVAVQEPYAVAVTGLSLLGRPTPERTVTAFDARTGDALWSRTLLQISPQFDESMLRGSAVIEEGTVIVAAVKQSQQKRMVGLYLIGLDAATGETKWIRTAGSIGSLPWSNGRQGAGDETIADRGILYRSDRLGVVAAIESANGRVRWVRRAMPETVTQSGFLSQQWQTNQAVLRGEQLFTLSPDRREVLVMNRRSGALERRLAAQRLGLPSYMLTCGDWLVGVGNVRVRALDLSAPDWFDRPSIPVADVTERGIRGRVVVHERSLMVPIATGIRIIAMPSPSELETSKPDIALKDDAEGADVNQQILAVVEPKLPSREIRLSMPGTVLAMESQLLVVDDERIHGYLLWDVAEKLLRERMAASTDNPEPAITYAELSHQSGRMEKVLPAVDEALAIIERDPLGQRHGVSRSRLFRALLEMVEPDAQSALTARLTPADRKELIERLARAAAEPAEQVAYRMAAGRALEAESQARAAAEMYQSILDSSVFASQSYTSRQTTLPADVEATRRLRDLVRSSGAAVYASFDAEAARRLGEMTAETTPEQMEALARRYPMSRAAAQAWSMAAERYVATQRVDAAVFALEEGYRAASEVLTDADPLLGSIVGRLILAQERAGRVIPAIRLIEATNIQRPGLVVSDGSAALDTQELLTRLRDRLASLERRPDIGEAFGKATALEGWSIVEPACGMLPGAPTDVALLGSSLGELAMFRFDRNSGTPEQVWAGVSNELYLFLSENAAYFGRSVGEMGTPDQVAIRRNLTTGKVQWATPPFRSIFAGDERPAPDPMLGGAFDTPLRSGVASHELFTMLDAGVFVLLERSGRIAAFDAESGDLIWSKSSTISQVFDAAMGAGHLVMIGADEAPSPHSMLDTEMRHTSLILEARTGQVLMRHEEPRPMRWTRVSPQGEVLIGGEPGVICIDAFRRIVKWRSESNPLENSIEAWLTPTKVIVRDRDEELWRVDLETGERDPQLLDTGTRLDQGYVRIVAEAMNDQFAIASQRGFAVFGATGELIAADARTGERYSADPVFAQSLIVTIEEIPADPQPDGSTMYSVGLSDLATGRAVRAGELPLPGVPSDMMLVDGVVLVSAGGTTFVVPAPAK